MNDFFTPCGVVFAPCSNNSIALTPNLRKNNTKEYEEQKQVLSRLIRGGPIRVTIVEPNCKCNPCNERRQKECILKEQQQQYCNDCEENSSDCGSDCADVDTDSSIDAIRDRFQQMPPPSRPQQTRYYYDTSSDNEDDY